MASVVGVHGIGQQYRTQPELERVWTDALEGGLRLSGQSRRIPGIRVAAFGDLFRQRQSLGSALEWPPYTAADLKDSDERALLEVLFQAASQMQPDVAIAPGALSPRTPVTVQRMVAGLLRSGLLAGMTERVLVGNLKQVVSYQKDSNVRDQIRARLEEAVDEETRVLIGHSLGSVITYEYLAAGLAPQVQLHLTCGSPLGIPRVIFDRLTPEPSRGIGNWAGSVRRWVNLADSGDFVAMVKSISPLFESGPDGRAIEDFRVMNGGKAHSCRRYLNSVETGSAIGSVLDEAMNA